MRIERSHLSAPLFILAVTLLLANDFHLKSAYPGLITGKLSDITGLFAFPSFFSILFPRQKLWIYIATAVGFIAWKLPAAEGTIAAINTILPYSIGRVADYSDYWALLVLPMAYFYRPRGFLWNNRVFQAVVASAAVFAFCATGGTHGFIKSYRYGTSKQQLEIYIDSVFTLSPEIRIPQGNTFYYERSDPYFRCYLVDQQGAEVFTVRYYGDKQYWEKHPLDAGISIVYAGKYNQPLKTEKDLSSEDKERLIHKFELGFIAKLNRFIRPIASDEE